MKYKQSRKGFLLIDALISLVLTSLLVALLASSVVVTMKSTKIIQYELEVLRARELAWWHESNGGCRDRCLIEELLYP